MSVESLPREAWPGNVDLAPVAQLSLTPAELADVAGVQFEILSDDLGPLEVAVVKTPAGDIFVLERHELSPAPGTAVSAETSTSHSAQLERLLDALGITSDAVTWVSPRIVLHPDDASRVPWRRYFPERSKEESVAPSSDHSLHARVLLSVDTIHEDIVSAHLSVWRPDSVMFPVSRLTDEVRAALFSQPLPAFITVIADLSATSPEELDLRQAQLAPIIGPEDDLVLQ